MARRRWTEYPVHIEESTAVRQKVGPDFGDLTARRVERRHGCGLSPLVRNAINPQAGKHLREENRARPVPAPDDVERCRAELLGRAAGHRDLLQLAIREEGDETAVRRPEGRLRPGCVLELGRLLRVERPKIEAPVTS